MSDLKTVLKNQQIRKEQPINIIMSKLKQDNNFNLPNNISIEDFEKLATQIYNNNPNLQNCEIMSFINALLKSVSLGLIPNTHLGQAYLIPNNNEVNLCVGYKGMIDIAYKNHHIKKIYATEVRANDKFDIQYGLSPNLIHKPCIKRGRGEVIGYYAVYHSEKCGEHFVYMDKNEILSHSKRYNSYGDNKYWEKEFDNMAKKTLIRKLLKYAPFNIQGGNNLWQYTDTYI